MPADFRVEINQAILTKIEIIVMEIRYERLVNNQSVERLAAEFDNDARFINGVVEFLVDMDWVKHDHISSLYQMTEIGAMKVRSVSKVILWT